MTNKHNQKHEVNTAKYRNMLQKEKTQPNIGNALQNSRNRGKTSSDFIGRSALTNLETDTADYHGLNQTSKCNGQKSLL